MLKRITELKNIGCFANARCGNVTFGRLTIIYGRNSYGKSTLADLLSSIQTGDLEILRKRKSIPRNPSPQRASLSFETGEDQKEEPLVLSSEGWSNIKRDPIALAVFNDRFYRDNIFIASSVNRSTKENFSEFILGEKGVAQAQQIAKSKREQGIAQRNVRELRTNAFSEIADLEQFLALPVDQPEEEAIAELDSIREEFIKTRAQRREATSIASRPDCRPPGWQDPFEEGFEKLCQTLGQTFESSHLAARAAVAEHIAKAFVSSDDAEPWIRAGLKHNNGSSCQFCSQPLGPAARSLLTNYQEAFDTAFQSHERTIEKRIDRIVDSLKAIPFADLELLIERNRTTCSMYPELNEDHEFRSTLERMDRHATEIENAIRSWKHREQDFFLRVDSARLKKKRFPHQAVTAPNASAESQILTQLRGAAERYSHVVTTANLVFSTFRTSADPGRLDSALARLEQQGHTQALIVERHRKAEQVDRYVALQRDLVAMASQIAQKQEELDIEQSGFLEHFFVSLNQWFKKFGSREFELEKAKSNQGYMPVFFLRVKFRGQLIPEKDLYCLFSESDQRALAAAVFWARLSNLKQEERAKMVVVLDDLLTSFDDARITAMHNAVIDLRDSVKQIIMLSHYKSEVARFLRNYTKTASPLFLAIEQQSGHSSLVRGHAEDFIKSEHERSFERIRAFVEQESDDHQAGDLRIFFEAEIAMRFALHLASANTEHETLRDRLNRLEKNDHLSADVAKMAHQWRNTLNPHHHGWSNADIEDQRRTARDFLNFVYHDLVPQKQQ